MTSKSKTLAKKPGLPPGTVVYTGGHLNPATLEVFRYSETAFEEQPLLSGPAAVLQKTTTTTGLVSWLNFSGLSDTARVEELCRAFSVHPLIVEDIVQVHQRPKFEDHDGHLYFTLKMIGWDDKSKNFVFEHVSLLLTQDTVLSFQELPGGDAFEWVRKRLRKNLGALRKMKADYLFASLVDAVVDSYFVALDNFSDKIQTLESRILVKSARSDIHEINALKRSLIKLRKAIAPLREALGSLLKSDSPLLDRKNEAYWRDVYDHVLYCLDLVESYRDFVGGLMEVHLSTLSYRLNEVMKVLAVFAAIFSPLTFIVGVYGMNFDVLPELHWKYGYAIVWGVMMATVVGMVAWFKKKKWL